MNEKLKQLLEKLANLETLTKEEKELLATLKAAQAIPAVAAAPAAAVVPNRRLDLSDEPIKAAFTAERIMSTPSLKLSNEEKELQSFFDDAYITASLMSAYRLHTGGNRVDPRELKMWQGLKESKTALGKALDTATAGEGAEWVPTTMSANIIEKYRLQSRVPALFDEIQMPRNPYVLPADLSDVVFYLMPESLTEEPSKTPPTNLATGNKTLTAKKLRARQLWSEELDELSIIPILPRVKDNLAISGALCVEDILINGDDSATHQDSDVTDSKDRRKSWKGLRKLVIAGNKKDLATFDATTVRGMLTAMGKYGVTPSQLAWISGVVDYNKMRGLAELLTVDKYGPAATILTGEVGKLYGSPVILSEKVRENLNATGVYDGTTMTKTVLGLVNTRAWLLGNWGAWRLTVDFDNDVDQYILNVRFRKAFIPIYDATTEGIVSIGYNIA